MTFKGGLLLLLGLAGVATAVGLYVAPESVETIGQKWELSTHADADSEAFTHWDGDDPPRIPRQCATCHSTLGFRDFLGEDGSQARQVDQPSQTGTVVFCAACHNPSAHAMTTVTFPSGVEIGGLGPEAVCMQCHQGRRSAGDVDEAIGELDDDAVSRDVTFVDVHYYIAAATWLGAEVRGGYQYADRSYVGRFEHVPDVQVCTDCHDPHSQEVPYEACTPCHVAVAGPEDLRSIRTTQTDYDGDGNLDEGLHEEIDTMQAQLYSAIQAYASEVATPLVYADRFPYYFVDRNGNGEADAGEIELHNSYSTWTPRLLRAAYNYHFSLQDRGNYAHNGRYILQLLYDSLDDLGQRVSMDGEGALRPASQ